MLSICLRPWQLIGIRKLYSTFYWNTFCECVVANWSRIISFSWPIKNYISIILALLIHFLSFVTAHRRMRTTTNYFLVNLSISDLLMSLFNCIFNFTYMLDSHWPFGAIYCTINNFVANVSVAASVFTLVAITLDR